MLAATIGFSKWSVIPSRFTERSIRSLLTGKRENTRLSETIGVYFGHVITRALFFLYTFRPISRGKLHRVAREGTAG